MNFRSAGILFIIVSIAFLQESSSRVMAWSASEVAWIGFVLLVAGTVLLWIANRGGK